MKFILFFIAFMFLGICMNAQDKQYESFDVKPHVVFIDDGQAEYRSVWIVPPGIEQPMDSLWREYLAKDIHVTIGLDMKRFWTVDSLNGWLSWDIDVRLKKDMGENAKERIRTRWSKAVPESLQKRLKEHVEENCADKDLGIYFQVLALVDSLGGLHSVYFEVDKNLIGLVEEQELQVIVNNIEQMGVEPTNFDFSKRTNAQMKALIDSLRNNQDDKERLRYFVEKNERQKIPVKYGVVRCFYLQHFRTVFPSSQEGERGIIASNSVPGRQIAAYLERFAKLAVGQTAPDFTVTRPNGDALTLYAVTAKYKLVVFWASWDVASRQANPQFIQLYQQFRPRSFEIVSVSLDDNRFAWDRAIEQDGISIWPNGSDLQGMDSPVAKAYMVGNTLPYTVLIDDENKIVAKGLLGNELRAAISDLTKKSKKVKDIDL